MIEKVVRTITRRQLQGELREKGLGISLQWSQQSHQNQQSICHQIWSLEPSLQDLPSGTWNPIAQDHIFISTHKENVQILDKHKQYIVPTTNNITHVFCQQIKMQKLYPTEYQTNGNCYKRLFTIRACR